MPRPRVAIVATGSELVRGDRRDRNGPFLAHEVLSLGLDPARIVIVGDDPAELEAALRDAFGADLCIVSGGLGPTHDDRTVELVARAAGLHLVVDHGLEAEIGAVSRAYAERLGRPYADFAHGVTKQATLPQGATVIGLAGTAPGFVLADGGATVVVLPGPPGELQRLWPRALEAEAVRDVLARARHRERRTLRLYGVSESTVARTLHEHGAGAGVDVTVCARDFEIHVDAFVEPGSESAADALVSALRAEHDRHVFAEDERPVEEIVLGLCRSLGLTIATAESCTGGLVSERLTSVPGSSDVFVGGIVAYADAVKEEQLGVPGDVLRRHGAVSAETAAAMAGGVRERLGADVGLAVTGIAGPGGGTAEKPVGLVYVHAETPQGSRGLDFSYPADRDSIRRRAAVAVLHLVRRVLAQIRHDSG
ncbi:MAG TPA: nicotinamide-nucleotide amidohydrolase family protein [Gaiellaceae bacterium]|nr:nicotinamide-nucleotide amidohydrolase family protein [Gaiellaceae bacterium]